MARSSWQSWNAWWRRDRGWKCTALILGAAWLSIGCSPASLGWLLLPFGDNTEPAVCKLASKDKEITVAIMSAFSNNQIETRLELRNADRDLGNTLGEVLLKRCMANKEKVKVVPAQLVASYMSDNLDRRSLSMNDIGKRFKADYVISMEIVSIRLLGGSSMYQGSTEIDVKVYDMHSPQGETVKFTKTFNVDHPREGRFIETASVPLPQFRAEFFNKIANDVARSFTAYTKEIGSNMD